MFVRLGENSGHGQLSSLGTESQPSAVPPWRMSLTTWQHSNKSIQARVPDTGNKSKATIRNLANAVGVLERWLLQQYNEKRYVEKIPPAELNRYLCEFYRIIKKPSGQDYDSLSFVNLRSCIHRFLKEKNYPTSIITSPEFYSSKEVYLLRQRMLQCNAVDK